MARRGKIIERWEFTVNRLEVTVPVKIHTPPDTDQDTSFSAEYTYGEHKFSHETTDIDDLRRKTKAWLKDIVTFDSKPFFYVTFGGNVTKPKVHKKASTIFSDKTLQDMRDAEEGEVVSQLEWRRYQVGTTADGQRMWRDCTRLMNNGDWIKGDLETGLNKRNFSHDYRETMNALIPATPENEAGLVRLAEAFESLHKNLKKFLSPKVIEHNFTKLIGTLPLMLESTEQSCDG